MLADFLCSFLRSQRIGKSLRVDPLQRKHTAQRSVISPSIVQFPLRYRHRFFQAPSRHTAGDWLVGADSDMALQ